MRIIFLFIAMWATSACSSLSGNKIAALNGLPCANASGVRVNCSSVRYEVVATSEAAKGKNVPRFEPAALLPAVKEIP